MNCLSIEHIKYGYGTAILVKHRLKRKDDLFMCSFGDRLEGRLFYCRKHFDEAEEVWIFGTKTKLNVNRRKNGEQLEQALRNIFFGSEPPN
jgi:hypothetical protein